MNPLSVTDKQTIIILQAKSLYLFSLPDLINIIETAICNSPSFFATPLSPKNPYNNEVFSISTLYNIYFRMKESIRLISVPFHLFFLEDFDKTNFSRNNEIFIRDFAIKKYVTNTHSDSLYNAVIRMLDTNFYGRKLLIDDDFPKDLLV